MPVGATEGTQNGRMLFFRSLPRTGQPDRRILSSFVGAHNLE
jgi:hypothetical protein